MNRLGVDLYDSLDVFLSRLGRLPVMRAVLCRLRGHVDKLSVCALYSVRSASVPMPRERGANVMKTAREIVHGVRGPCFANGAHDGTCDGLTAIIEQARREGAEWMREQAAEYVESNDDDEANDAQSASDARGIRALPVTP